MGTNEMGLKLRNYIFGLALTSALALAAFSANAADIYRAPEGGGYKDGPVYVANTWTGFYVGVNGGYGWNSTSSKLHMTGADPLEQLTFPGGADIDAAGGFGGGQIGYNMQRGAMVYGLEADLQGAGIKDAKSISIAGDEVGQSFGASAHKSLDWFGTVRGRLGYAFDRTLVYATGGLAFGGIKNSLSASTSDGSDCTFTAPICSASSSSKKDETRIGYVLGAGLEYALTPAWSIKGEYQYINLGSSTLSASATVTDPTDPTEGTKASVKVDNTYNTVRVGLNYHVGQGYEPLK